MSTFIDHEPPSLKTLSSDAERAGWWQASDLRWYAPELHADCALVSDQDAIFPPEKDEPPTKSVRGDSKADQTDELFQSMVAHTTNAQTRIKKSRPAPPKMGKAQAKAARKGARRPRSNN